MGAGDVGALRPHVCAVPHQAAPRVALAETAHGRQNQMGSPGSPVTRFGSIHSFSATLNGPWHKVVLRAFMVVVLAHLAEHVVQAYQVYALRWPVHQARGALGQWFPWLVHSEVLHYGYALVMLVGIWILLPGFSGRARQWWLATLVIQFWHHIEHALLQGQVIVGRNLFGSPVPVSIAQLWIPRVELHLLYNSLVLVPMLVAMYYHLFPMESERGVMRCTCALRTRTATA
jgi:hypothetical protein